MNNKEKIKEIYKWFKSLDSKDKNKVALHLIEYAVDCEYISIFNKDDAEELAEENNEPIDKYIGPYFTTC